MKPAATQITTTIKMFKWIGGLIDGIVSILFRLVKFSVLGIGVILLILILISVIL